LWRNKGKQEYLYWRRSIDHLSHLPGPHPRLGKRPAAIATRAGDRQLFIRTEETIPALLSATQELHYYCRLIVRLEKSKADKAPNHMNQLNLSPFCYIS
jgi:hypothetical protein